jgi:hypothetical protein
LFYENLLQTESKLPFRLSWSIEGDLVRLGFRLLAPEIIEAQRVTNFSLEEEFIFNATSCLANENCYININNQLVTFLTESGEIDLLLDTVLANSIALSTDQKTEYYDYTFFDLNLYVLKTEQRAYRGGDRLIVKIPKVILQSDVLLTQLNIEGAKDCRPLQGGVVVKEQHTEGTYYQAISTSVCDHFYLPDLDHSLSYLIRLKAQNLAGLPAIFAVQVDSLGRSPLESYLSNGINYQVLPPTENFNQSYTLYFSTDSYSKTISKNLLESVEIFFWPYNFLKKIYWQHSQAELSVSQLSNCDLIVNKKTLWLYQADLPENCAAKYISLAQAYDRGWLAYQDGKKLEHLKLNNWANTWLLPDEFIDTRIYIFYWPQLLEYFGLSGIVILFIYILFSKYGHRAKRLKKKRS